MKYISQSVWTWKEYFLIVFVFIIYICGIFFLLGKAFYERLTLFYHTLCIFCNCTLTKCMGNQWCWSKNNRAFFVQWEVVVWGEVGRRKECGIQHIHTVYIYHHWCIASSHYLFITLHPHSVCKSSSLSIQSVNFTNIVQLNGIRFWNKKKPDA